MKKLIAISLLAVAALGVATHAFAGANPNANIALDVQAKSKTRSCVGGLPVYSSCSVIVPTQAAATGDKDIMVVVYHVVGITGAEWSVSWTYDNETFVSWSSCSDLATPVLPGIGESMLSVQQVYSACTVPSSPEPGTGGICIGWFRLTNLAADVFTVGNPRTGGAARVVDCAFSPDEFHTLHNGSVVTPAPGPAPCTMGPTATETSTWSGVKALYR